MKSNPRRSATRSATASASVSSTTNGLSPELVWHHLGRAHRVTIWPDVAFEQEIAPGLWRPYTPDPLSDVFTSGAVMINRRRWSPYLDFCPMGWKSLVERFSFHRLHALAALAYCPTLHEEFAERPVLALMVAAHADLRGGGLPQWGELHAVCDRGGIYAVLEWLGLPSTRACLEYLGELDQDMPIRDLVHVREVLWRQHDAAARRARSVSMYNPLAA